MANDKAKSEETSGKIRLGFSLSAEAQRLLQEIKKETGLSQTAVVETVIREKAKSLGIR